MRALARIRSARQRTSRGILPARGETPPTPCPSGRPPPHRDFPTVDMPYRLPPQPTQAVAVAPTPTAARPVLGEIILSRGILGTHVLTVYEAGTDIPIFVGEFHPSVWDPRVVPRIEAFLDGTTLPTPLPDVHLVVPGDDPAPAGPTVPRPPARLRLEA